LITLGRHGEQDSRPGRVLSVEYLKFNNGRIASSLLAFERLHWPEVMAELTRRAST
jgi:hypothetical protein